jgi:hypothetical protein
MRTVGPAEQAPMHPVRATLHSFSTPSSLTAASNAFSSLMELSEAQLLEQQMFMRKL